MHERALIGHDAPIAAFQEAIAGGRMHHGWLLTGEVGLGKALFAMHAAAVLLSGQDTDFRSALSTPSAKLILQGSHPDFRLIRPEEGKATETISVDQIRALAGFFQTTAAMGGWRVVIIDAADNLNRAAANAILKLLEEPPARSVLFLVSHAPGRLLPTIRSRCRTLAFAKLSDEDVMHVLTGQADDEVEAILPFAQGSPGRALALLEGHALDYAGAIERLFESLPALDRRALFGLADQMSDRVNTPAYQTGWVLLEDAAAKAVRASVQSAKGYGGIPMRRWLAFCEGLAQGRRQIEALNLSPRQTLISLFSQLAPSTA